jgi:lambda family phage portal protein
MRQLPVIQPTLIDRVVRFFDPKRGLERHRARTMLALSGGYSGGKRDRRSMSEWKAGSGSSDADLLPDLQMLRDRARDLVRNAPLASGALGTVVTNVVGTGLDPQSRIDRDVLGLQDEAADAWQKQAEREWWLWAGSPECDASRTQDFCSLQDLVFRSTLESGDVFVLKRYLDRPGSPYGLKLQVLEGDRVTNPRFVTDQTKISTGNMVAGGVEVDSNGAPVAYHVLRQHPGDLNPYPQEWDRLPAFGEASGERVVFHLFRKIRPGQTRGVPYLATVIESFKQLSRYSEAEIMAAVISSMFTVFTKTEAGDGLGMAQPTAETGARASDEDYKLAPGAILDLLPGEDVTFANPQRPNTAFDPFVLAICRQIGVSLELPYEILIKHFTASYSAARAAMLEAWKFFRARRQWLTAVFCQPIYEALITEAVASGRLDAPGFFEDPILRQAWCGAKWTGPPAGQIDPEAEINAAKTRMELGISTGAEVTAELTGGDIEENIQQLGKERALREAAGLGQPDEQPAPEQPKPEPGPDNRRSQRARA